MKKIMFLMYSLRGGGAERVLMDTVNHLNHEKYDITVQTLFHEDTMISLMNSSIKYKSVFRVKSRILKKLISGVVQYVIPPALVYKLFFKDDYDVEVAFMEAFPTMILANSDNCKAKKYAWVHTDVNEYTRQDRLFRSLEHQKKAYETFDGIYCVAEGVKKSFQKKFRIYEKVDVVYNILNEKAIEAKKEEPCADFEKKDFTMISVGSLVPIKGFERLIAICGRLREEGHSFQLLILGDGPLKESLQKQIEQLGLQDTVKMLSFKKNPYSYMSKCDLYVGASYAEGFSTVVSESVILNLPVITTECSGMREILGDSEYGMITENDEKALYQGIKKILSDKECYEFYKKKVQERSSFFKMDTRIREYERILDQS